MAVQTKATVNAALALIVAQLDVIVKDATLAGIAAENKDPRAPLRQIEKMFNITDSGAYAINTRWINDIYNGAGTAVVNRIAREDGNNVKKIIA